MAGRKKSKSASSGKASTESKTSVASVENVLVQPDVQIKVKKKRSPMSQRADVKFPCARVLRYLRQGNYAAHVQKVAGVYCAAALEYLVAEVLELAGDSCRENKKKRINPRHLVLSIRQDAELDELLRNVVISQGGVVPQIQNALLPVNSKKRKVSPAQIVNEPAISESYDA